MHAWVGRALRAGWGCACASADDEQFKEEKAVIIKEISMLDSPGEEPEEEA
jgi:hypothetical protein